MTGRPRGVARPGASAVVLVGLSLLVGGCGSPDASSSTAVVPITARALAAIAAGHLEPGQVRSVEGNEGNDGASIIVGLADGAPAHELTVSVRLGRDRTRPCDRLNGRRVLECTERDGVQTLVTAQGGDVSHPRLVEAVRTSASEQTQIDLEEVLDLRVAGALVAALLADDRIGLTTPADTARLGDQLVITSLPTAHNG